MKNNGITIIDFVTDPDILGLTLSKPQGVLLRAIYGLPLTKSQQEIWRLCTSRDSYPRHGFAEVTVIAGARAGKDSRIACPIAAYEACFGGHERKLGRGEYGTIPLIAQDTRATKIAFNYLRDYFTESKLLRSMLDGDPYSNEIRLKNRISIACFPSTLATQKLPFKNRGQRGFTLPVPVITDQNGGSFSCR